MNADFEDPGLVAAVRASTAEARRSLDAHPTSDQLLAYHDRELADDEAERLREHLALCAECAQRALDLEVFSHQTLSEAPGGAEADAAWAKTRRALARKGLVPEARKKPWMQARWMLTSPRLAYAAAAVFFLTSVGLSMRLVDISRSLRELAGMRADPEVLGLQPLGIGGQRNDDASDPKIVGAGKDLALILNVLDPGSYLRYRVEILSRHGAAISTDVTLNSETDFTILLPRRLLKAGPHRVLLYGIDDAQSNLIEEYELMITDAD